MSVVIDRVVGQVEPEAPAAGERRDGGETPAPRQPEAERLRRLLRRLEHRCARLEAD